MNHKVDEIAKLRYQLEVVYGEVSILRAERDAALSDNELLGAERDRAAQAAITAQEQRNAALERAEYAEVERDSAFKTISAVLTRAEKAERELERWGDSASKWQARAEKAEADRDKAIEAQVRASMFPSDLAAQLVSAQARLLDYKHMLTQDGIPPEFLSTDVQLRQELRSAQTVIDAAQEMVVAFRTGGTWEQAVKPFDTALATHLERYPR